jgi:signal transduction histidine kinase
MLHEFLTANQNELIARCRLKVSERSTPRATESELEYGVPLFLEQLIKTLEVEQTSRSAESIKVPGRAADSPISSETCDAAARLGRELLQDGFTIEQVVHDYGDLCQAITDLAHERDEKFEVDEFRTLNRCLDNGIADAVKEFSRQRDFIAAVRESDAINQRLGFLAHELRNGLNTAALALQAIKGGNVGLNGATGAILDRSLVGLRTLIDRSLTEVRMAAGIVVERRLFSLADFIAEVKLSASLEADVRGCTLLVSEVDPHLAVEADRDLLFAAVGNLLQNAFKFTEPGSEVTLSSYGAADRVLLDIKDNCGGLPAGDALRIFQPFVRTGQDTSGLGLGLSISRRSVEANSGTLSVRDIPGTGCVFTINLPRRSLTETSNN